MGSSVVNLLWGKRVQIMCVAKELGVLVEFLKWLVL